MWLHSQKWPPARCRRQEQSVLKDTTMADTEERHDAIRTKYADILNCGFEFNDGWLTIADDMLDDMVRRVEAAGHARSALEIRQVKEKYGTLRCYYRAPVDLE